MTIEGIVVVWLIALLVSFTVGIIAATWGLIR